MLAIEMDMKIIKMKEISLLLSLNNTVNDMGLKFTGDIKKWQENNERNIQQFNDKIKRL